MRTLAGTYCKNSVELALLIASVALIASCSTARHGTISDRVLDTQPSETAEESTRASREKERPSSSFQEYKGDKRHVVASWYGPDFHGRPTSSGEPFNMYALTCAHKEYPFGTKLRVINRQNNKEVECIVNDRGPFIAGRDLDLSYAAAKRIDLVGPGTGPVLIEPVGRDLRYVRYVRYGASEGTLTVQVGSFRDEGNAKRLKMALEIKYKSIYIMEADVGGSKYYRVRAGKFKSKADAFALGKSLADEGYNVIVTKYEQQI